MAQTEKHGHTKLSEPLGNDTSFGLRPVVVDAIQFGDEVGHIVGRFLLTAVALGVFEQSAAGQ